MLAWLGRILHRLWVWYMEPMPFPRDHWYQSDPLSIRYNDESEAK